MAVEKPTIATDLCGNFPLNPVFLNILNTFLTAGEIRERFLGIKGAKNDPRWDYCNNQFWFQKAQMDQAEKQMQMAAQQPQQPPPDGGDGGGGPPTPSPDRHDEGYIANGGAMGNQSSKQQAGQEDQAQNLMDAASPTADIEKAALEAFNEIQKSEMQLPPAKRKIIAQHEKLVNSLVNGFMRDSKGAIREILETAKKLGPTK